MSIHQQIEELRAELRNCLDAEERTHIRQELDIKELIAADGDQDAS
ncbi:hypothetical protein [Methylocella tundrae]|uniref:Uncharacterized protein n=1 Tax=Methylocella tundrae TaxID=227605 RepID=A0A4U8Z8U2_METTU|nr:hypothetical protein [Methylocella tundrae]WPP02786.1 hypothetical protein SIN04_00315 [Methylocella tundrae]VFU17580.1 protein of unknown function [Methylocella tundrae]